MRLLFEPRDESANSPESRVEIVDAEEQQEPVARCRLVRTPQGGMVVRTPLMEAEQDGSIRIQDLTKVVVVRSRQGLAKERLVPSETARDVPDAYDRPCAFHRTSALRPTPHVGCRTGRARAPPCPRPFDVRRQV